MDNMESRIFDELNSEQKAAVESLEGPVLIIAGAGSGKTRVLTGRIAYLLENGVPPENILALTFTKKAANEMRERIGAIVGRKARRIYMGTFHGIFVRFLREYADRLGYPESFTIHDTGDSRNVIKACVKELGLDEKVYKPQEVLSRISMAKNNLVTASAYRNNQQILQADFAARKGQLCEIYSLYSSKCKQSGVMDFDDILLNMNILLRDCQEAMESLRERFRYILVDEYQDTNYAQYLIIRKLSEFHRNICVVGDDSQSIYAFRGARVENILNFKKDYPEAKTFRLEQNYRSTQTIVNAANSVIEHNRERLEKKCFSVSEPGEKIALIKAFTEQEEALLVAASVSSRIYRDNARYQDIAVLYRTNAQSRAIEEALRRKNIPYRIYSGNSFFDREEIKDMVSYMKFVVNPADDEALRRIINKPARGIGATSVSALSAAAASMGVPLWTAIFSDNLDQHGLKGSAVSKIRDFAGRFAPIINKATHEDAYQVACSVMLESGIRAMYASDRSQESQSRVENIDELLNGIKSYLDEETNTRKEIQILEGGTGDQVATVTLSDYLENISLMSDVDIKDDGDSLNRVSLMTVHSSKGLEFPYVYVAGMEENLFPSANIASEREVEEERRLFYVALTRAAKFLCLSYAVSRMRYGQHQSNPPSRFISEIDPQYIARGADSNVHRLGSKSDAISVSRQVKNTAVPLSVREDFVPDPTLSFKVGMRVEHNRFGSGVILSMEGSGNDLKALIRFDSMGEKTLLMKYAKMRKL